MGVHPAQTGVCQEMFPSSSKRKRNAYIVTERAPKTRITIVLSSSLIMSMRASKGYPTLKLSTLVLGSLRCLGNPDLSAPPLQASDDPV